MTAIHLVVLSWALGGMSLPVQWLSLVFAVAGFVISLLPRDCAPSSPDGKSFRLIMWPRLIRFPVFWLGGALLGYIVVQALNPAWVFEQNSSAWWMRSAQHIAWLPSGVSAPLGKGGPWRELLILASVWLTICSLWVGFTRRHTVHLFLTTLAANGFALATLGIAQRLAPSDKMFWLWTLSGPDFFASFVYRNHAGAYLNLALAVTCGLGAWHFVRGSVRMAKSSPAGLFAFLAICIGVSVVVSYSRGATLVMFLFVALMIAVFITRLIRTSDGMRSPLITLPLLLVFGLFLWTGHYAFRSHSQELQDRLGAVVTGNDDSVRFREIANRASLDMLRTNWLRGHGAGSFRFLFPSYQQHYPDIFTKKSGEKAGMRYYWDHAHNDFLEFAVEFGAFGLAALALALGYWITVLVRAAFWTNLLSTCLVLGCLVLLVHGLVDFVFHCPAILMTWGTLWPCATLLALHEEVGAGGHPPSRR